MTKAGKAELWEQLFQYWLSKCVDGHAPGRADLDPMIEIPHLAAHLMIIDVLPDGYQYRLVGSDIRGRLGIELTGGRVARGTETESKWQDLLGVTNREQKPLVVTADMPAPLTGKRMAVLLPLVDRTGRTEQILAGIFFGKDFRPGMRIGTLAVQDLMTEEPKQSFA